MMFWTAWLTINSDIDRRCITGDEKQRQDNLDMDIKPSNFSLTPLENPVFSEVNKGGLYLYELSCMLISYLMSRDAQTISVPQRKTAILFFFPLRI